MKAAKAISISALFLLLIGCVASTSHTIYPEANLNSYRYVVIYPLDYQGGTEDKFGIGTKFANLFRQKEIEILDANEVRTLPQDELGQLLKCHIRCSHTPDGMGGSYATVVSDLYNALDQRVYRGKGRYNGLSISADLDGAVTRAFQGFAENYSGFSPVLAFDVKKELRKQYRNWKRINISEDQLRKYFDQDINNLDPIEGIWTELENNQYRIGIFKNKKSAAYDFVAIIVESETPYWEPHQIKIEFQKTVSEFVYTTTYYMLDHSKQGTTAIITDNGLLEMTLKALGGKLFKMSYTKNYPANKDSNTLQD